MSNDEGRFSEAKVKELAAKKMEEIAQERGARCPEPGASLDFSVEVHELLTQVESDPFSAMKLLEILARDLRARTLPNRMLADHVAGAIEATACKPMTHHARSLTDELYLTSQGRRPAGSWQEIGRAMWVLIRVGISQTKASREVAVEYDVDERTAREYYKQYKIAREMHDSTE